MIILGIETSCDDTSVAVVKDGHNILSNIVSSQEKFHAKFSGVVPEIASRRHLEVIHFLVEEALEEAGLSFQEIDKIAVTNRPGLVGSLLVGVAAAKGYSYAKRISLVPVNHLAGHLFSVSLEKKLEYPLLGLLISGGHTVLVKSESPEKIEIIGSTIDDAVGEVYDKIAKYFGLGYPGGPVIDRLAKDGDAKAFDFPRSLLDKKKHLLNFSFSGIKTAVIHQRERFCQSGELDNLPNISASFQAAVADILLEKVRRAIKETGINRVAVAGGVSANGYLRERFAQEDGFNSYFPPRALCMDNGAMIAGVAYYMDEELSPDESIGLDAYSRVIERSQLMGRVKKSS